MAAAACAMAMDASLAAQGRPMQLRCATSTRRRSGTTRSTGEGTFLETTIYVARQFGAPPEALWPYKALNRKIAARRHVERPRSSGRRATRPTSRRYPTSTASSARSTRACPSSSLRTPQSRGDRTSRRGPASDPAAGATGDLQLGGTVITIVGYDPATRRFKFANNWGAAGATRDSATSTAPTPRPSCSWTPDCGR